MMSSCWLTVSQSQASNEQATKTAWNVRASTGQQVMLHKRDDDNRVIVSESEMNSESLTLHQLSFTMID